MERRRLAGALRRGRRSPTEHGAAAKVAVGGLAGLIVGAIVGGIGALVMVFKSAKKLVTLR